MLHSHSATAITLLFVLGLLGLPADRVRAVTGDPAGLTLAGRLPAGKAGR